MPTYYVDFANQTDRTWTMSVYQTVPGSIGLKSVSWKQTTVPKQGESGVEWEVDYNVVLGDLKQTGGKGVYKASQTLPTALGKKWNIVYKDGVQQLEEVGGAEPGQIVVFNASGEVAMPGMGMSGQASVFKENVLSGSQAQFEVTPTYYAGLFNNVVVGEVISHNVAVGPETLKFPSGLNMATLTAYLDGSSIRLKVAYSQGSSFSMDEVEARITTIEAFNKQAA